MQQQAGFAMWDFLVFWVFTGSSLLGLPPGERDAALVQAVPPQTLVYFEWASRGQGQVGATGIDGFAADPEVRYFFDQLNAALIGSDAGNQGPLEPAQRDLLQLSKICAAQPGGLFLGFEPMAPGKQGVAGLIDRLKGLHGGLILSTGSETDASWTLLMRILARNPKFSYDAASNTQLFPLPLPGYQLVVHREGPRILFALGEGTLPRIIEGLSGRTPGLATNPKFKQSMERVAVPRVSTVTWVDGQGLIGAITNALGPVGLLVRPMLSIVGVDALDNIAKTSGVENGTMTQRTFAATGGRTDGVLVLLAGQPIQAPNLAHIPADADLVMAASLSLPRTFQEARRVLATAQPLSIRIFDQAVKQIESDLQLKIVDDVLPAFGDVITAFDSPSLGGMVGTSLIVSLEVRNAPKAAIVFERLIKAIEQSITSTNQADSLRRQAFMGQTIAYINRVDGSAGHRPPITPTFCLTDRHLLFSIHPQAMKAYLRHLQSNRTGFNPSADRNAAAAMGDILFYGYLNGPRAYGVASAVAPFIGQAWISELEAHGWSINSFAIPSAAAVTPYFGNSTAVVSRQATGLFIEARNVPPILAAFALASAYEAWQSWESEHGAPKSDSSDGLQLGPVSGAAVPAEIVPAVTQAKATETKTEPAPSPYRKLAPGLLKSLIPEEYQSLVPESAYRRLEEGPSQETLQRREDARRKREDRRRRRLGPPSTQTPAPPPPVPMP